MMQSTAALFLTIVMVVSCRQTTHRSNTFGEKCYVLQEWYEENPTLIHITRYAMSDLVFLGLVNLQTHQDSEYSLSVVPICYYKGFTSRKRIIVGGIGNSVVGNCAGSQQNPRWKQVVFAVRKLIPQPIGHGESLYVAAIDYGVINPTEFLENIPQLCINHQPQMSVLYKSKKPRPSMCNLEIDEEDCINDPYKILHGHDMQDHYKKDQVRVAAVETLHQLQLPASLSNPSAFLRTTEGDKHTIPMTPKPTSKPTPIPTRYQPRPKDQPWIKNPQTAQQQVVASANKQVKESSIDEQRQRSSTDSISGRGHNSSSLTMSSVYVLAILLLTTTVFTG